MRAYLALAGLALVACANSSPEQAQTQPPAPEPTVAKQAVPESTTPSPEADKPAPLSATHEEALRYLLSDKEPKIKDATWTAGNVLKVGVVDDGSRRDGFAEYVCLALSDYKLPKPFLVGIIDIDKLRATGDWVQLGKSVCD